MRFFSANQQQASVVNQSVSTIYFSHLLRQSAVALNECKGKRPMNRGYCSDHEFIFINYRTFDFISLLNDLVWR